MHSGSDIPKGEVIHQETIAPNKAEQELPSTSDVAKADDIELQETKECG